MQDAGLRWYVQTLTADAGSEKWLGITAAIASLPIVLFSPLAGALADRWPKPRIIAGTQSIGMVLALAVAILVWIGAMPLWAVFIVAWLHGTLLAFDIPARQAFAIEMVGPKHLMSAIGLNSTVFNLGRLLGPMAAGFVMTAGSTVLGLMVLTVSDRSTLPSATVAGIAACFFLNAFSYLGLVVVLLTMPVPSVAGVSDAPKPRARGWRDLLAGVQAVRERPSAWGLMATLAIFLLAGGSYPTLMPALADYVFHADEFGFSALLTANGLGSVIGALIVASTHAMRSRRLPILTGLTLVSVGLIMTARAPSLPIACLSLGLTGAGLIMFLASSNSVIQSDVPDNVRGRVMSLWVLTFGAGLPVGSLIAGQLAEWLGTANAIFLQGLGSIPAIAVAAVVLGKADRRRLERDGVGAGDSS
jgi:MFS family permease